MNEKENPWKTLDVKEVYSNPWIRVEEHSVLTPSGDKGIYGKVCALGRTVAAVPLDNDGNVILVGQYRYPTESYSWEIPEGAGAPGEEPLDAAKRELKEETGYEAEEWRELMRIHTSNCVSNEEAVVFVAHNLHSGQASPDPTEKLAVKKVPFSIALDMVMKGEITDAITIAALLKAARMNIADERVQIIYEDEWCVAVYKPPGLLVHRTNICSDRKFLLQRVRNQVKTKVYPIHRLDRATSGIVLFAKDKETAAPAFFDLFQSRSVRKTYFAVVRGFTDDEGVIEIPLKNHMKNNTDQAAYTEYETIDRTELPIPVGPYETSRYSLVKVNIKTGRTHQIRRHFNQIAHPVIGDSSSGDRFHNRSFKDNFHCSRLLLFAQSLEFKHPFTGEAVALPADFDEEFLEILRKINLNLNLKD